MNRHVSDSVAYYAFEFLQDCPDVVHAVSTRHGGSSPKPFESLNLSKSVGDDPDLVHSNLGALHFALGLDLRQTVSARQARADQVALVGRSHAGNLFSDVDALVTNTPGVSLLLRFADCVPILLYDPVHHAAGVVHTGWSGTVLCIVTKAIQAMVKNFGTRARDLIAGIGPSIGPCCYCIGPDVVQRVQDVFAYSDALLNQRNGQVFFDLWEANARQMRELGVWKIESAMLCTSHNTEDFYSARAEQPVTGRFGAIIALR